MVRESRVRVASGSMHGRKSAVASWEEECAAERGVDDSPGSRSGSG